MRIHQSIVLPVFLLLPGCYYPLGGWEERRTADAPWAAPARKAVSQQRAFGFFIVPAAQYRYRLVDGEYFLDLYKYSEQAERYLRTTPDWKQWPDVPREERVDQRKESPYHAVALLSVNPEVFVMWKEKADIGNWDYVSGLAIVALPFQPGVAAGVSKVPDVKELWWFSPALKRGPLPVERIDDRRAQIAWQGGRLVLTHLPDGWHVARE